MVVTSLVVVVVLAVSVVLAGVLVDTPTGGVVHFVTPYGNDGGRTFGGGGRRAESVAPPSGILARRETRSGTGGVASKEKIRRSSSEERSREQLEQLFRRGAQIGADGALLRSGDEAWLLHGERTFFLGEARPSGRLVRIDYFHGLLTLMYKMVIYVEMRKNQFLDHHNYFLSKI